MTSMRVCSARFIGEHIPGKPTVVPQNMPGAGSRSAANWLYKIAPKDGTVIATLGQATPTDQALGQPGVQFDARKFNWIGNLAVVNNFMFVWAETGVKTIDDAKQKPLAIGASGASSPSVLYPQVSNNLLGTKFKIVAGYPGGGDINIAVERREVDGRGSDSWASMKSTHPDWIKRSQDQHPVPGRPQARGRSARRAAVERARAERRPAPGAGNPVRRRRGGPADPDRARRSRRPRQGAAQGIRRHAARPRLHRGGEAGQHVFQPDGRRGAASQVVDKIASPPERILALVKQAIEIKDVQKKGL